MAGLSPAHLLVILIIALIVIGPGKLPELGAAIGKRRPRVPEATGGLSDQLLPGGPAASQAGGTAACPATRTAGAADGSPGAGAIDVRGPAVLSRPAVLSGPAGLSGPAVRRSARLRRPVQPEPLPAVKLAAGNPGSAATPTVGESLPPGGLADHAMRPCATAFVRDEAVC